MEELMQEMISGGQMPAATALLLGLLTAISPCPLATNIAAIGYIGKTVEGGGRKVFVRGLFYTLGRLAAYWALGVVLIVILRGSGSVFGIERFVSHWGELLIGPILLVAGIYMLLQEKIKLKGFGFSGGGEGLARRGWWGSLLIGMLFAMAFCPTSAVFYFGMLIPMSVAADGGLFLPALFAVATALPVLAVAWILAFSASSIGRFYGRMGKVQKWANWIVGALFVGIGLFYTINTFIL